MKIIDVDASILDAATMLRERGIKATAGRDCIAVESAGHPAYLARGVWRETWDAMRIADDIERIERQL